MSIEQGTSINPLDPSGNTPQRTRITVVIHEFGDRSLEESDVAPAVPRAGVRPAGGRHRAPESAWDFADRVLGSWPIALRLAFLFLVLITGTAVLAAAVGVVGQLVLAGIAFRTQRRRRPRLPELVA
jgi:hypothetical protein